MSNEDEAFDRMKKALRFLKADPRILDDETFGEISRQVDEMPDSRQKSQSKRTLNFYDRAASAIDTGISALGEEANVDQGDVANALRDIRDDAVSAGRAAANSTAGRYVRRGAEELARAIDAPGRYGVRLPLEKALDLPEGSFETSGDFHAAAEAKALSGDERAQLFQSIKGPLGGAIGGALLGKSLVGAGIGALAGVLPEVLDRAGYPEAARFGRDFAFDAGVDPLNAIGIGPQARGTAAALRRLAPVATDQAKITKALAGAEARIASEFTPSTGAAIRKEFVAAGVPDEAFTRAFGKKNERLMRGQLEVLGMQPAAITEKIAKALGKPGGGEFLGEKIADAVMAPVQTLRGSSKIPLSVRPGLPFINHDRPLFKETFGQERQRQRFMDIADRQARALASEITEQELKKAALAGPKVAALKSAAARDQATKNAIESAFSAGDAQGKALLEARLKQIFGGHTLPIQGENFLREMAPGGLTGSRSDLLRANEILNKGWQAKHLIGVPAFTIRNISEDLSKMVAAGVTPADLWRSASTIRAAEKGNVAARARLQEIIDSGVDLGVTRRQDFSRLEGRREAERKLAKLYNARATSDPSGLAMLDRFVSAAPTLLEKLPAWTLLNRKALNSWESVGRTALWERAREQGLPPVLAGERQARLLFDYGRPLGPHDRLLRNFFSFMPYKTQAPVAAATLLAERPGAAQAMLAFGDAMEPRLREGEVQAPSYQTSLGFTRRLPDFITSARRLGVRDGETAIPDGTFGTLPFAPVNELSQPFEFADAVRGGPVGIIDELKKNASPNLQALLEIGTQRRVLTGEKIDELDKEILAKILDRVSPSIFLDKALERGLNAWDDSAFPDRFIGAHDQENLNAYNDLNFLLMNQLWPGKISDPDYTQRLKNLTAAPDLASLQNILEIEARNRPTRKIKEEFPK